MNSRLNVSILVWAAVAVVTLKEPKIINYGIVGYLFGSLTTFLLCFSYYKTVMLRRERTERRERERKANAMLNRLHKLSNRVDNAIDHQQEAN